MLVAEPLELLHRLSHPDRVILGSQEGTAEDGMVVFSGNHEAEPHHTREVFRLVVPHDDVGALGAVPRLLGDVVIDRGRLPGAAPPGLVEALLEGEAGVVEPRGEGTAKDHEGALVGLVGDPGLVQPLPLKERAASDHLVEVVEGPSVHDLVEGESQGEARGGGIGGEGLLDDAPRLEVLGGRVEEGEAAHGEGKVDMVDSVGWGSEGLAVLVAGPEVAQEALSGASQLEVPIRLLFAEVEPAALGLDARGSHSVQ